MSRLDFVVLLTVGLCLATVQGQDYNITTSTYFGDSFDAESVVGIAFQSDGDIVVALNAGPSVSPLSDAVLLNGAAKSSVGAVLLLNSAGTEVKAAARIAAAVYDLAVDSSDRIYVAAGRDGGISLSQDLSSVRWKVNTTVNGPQRAYVHRVDVGTGNTVGFLTSSLGASESSLNINPGQGTVILVDTAGVESARFATAAGRNALDLAIHDESDTVVIVGWRQASTNLQIAHIRGLSFTGSQRFTAYDWSTDSSSDDYINKPENNAADTRLSRVTLGEDGKLYAAGHSDGGNHIFRYSPMDIGTSVKSKIANYDKYTDYSSAGSAALGFLGRYSVSAGGVTFEAGQGVMARTDAKSGKPQGEPNTFNFEGGGVAVDEDGRVYLGGGAASSLPFSPSQWYTKKPGEEAFNPFPDDYGGGAAFQALYFNSTAGTYTRRLYSTRLSFKRTLAVAVRTFSGIPRIAYGGNTDSRGAYTTSNALQPTKGSNVDGFFVVHVRGQNSNPFDDGPASCLTSWLDALHTLLWV